MTEIDAQVRDLQHVRQKLEELTHACDHRGSPSDCLMLHALEVPEKG